MRSSASRPPSCVTTTTTWTTATPGRNNAKGKYTPNEGLNLANQNNRKLEVFGRKLEETSQNCIDILINISEKRETILFN